MKTRLIQELEKSEAVKFLHRRAVRSEVEPILTISEESTLAEVGYGEAELYKFDVHLGSRFRVYPQDLPAARHEAHKNIKQMIVSTVYEDVRQKLLNVLRMLYDADLTMKDRKMLLEAVSEIHKMMEL